MFPRFLQIALLLGLLALVGLVRCWNAADVLVAGRTFFVDPDCYSRMTRVEAVLKSPGRVVHEHEFENWPQGTRPHTTAPFDYLCAGLAAAIRGSGQTSQAALDWAGAWISPLLGLLTAAFLWFWGGRRPYRVPMLLFFAVSPILVQGTVLGRPDHQSLLMLCMAVALGAEVALLEKPSPGWALTGGLAWGFGLWVSLYEPLVLGVVAIVCGRVAAMKLSIKERLYFWLPLVAVGLLALWVEGGRFFAMPDAAVRGYFANWSRTVGELAHVPPVTLFHWLGGLLLFVPALAWRGWKQADRASRFWLVLLAALIPLTFWQARWGYFLALVFAMSIPSLLSVFTKPRLACLVFVVALWPIGLNWKQQLAPAQLGLRAEKRLDNLALYDVALQLRGERRLPILAPWWQSPALAYWSGQPCVAGSSHESLSGTVDASRFYLSRDPAEAEAILARRKVACVVAYEPDRVNAVSSAILGQPVGEGTMGEYLYRRPHSPPPFLQLAYSNAAFRVFLRPAGIEP